MFEVALLFIIAAAILAVATVWIFFWVLAKIVRAALWGLSLPARAVRGAQNEGLILERATPVERRCANPHCCSEMPAEARFCGRCGSAVTTGALLHEPLPDATYIVKKKWKKRLKKGKWQVVGGVTTIPTVLPPRRCKVSRVA